MTTQRFSPDLSDHIVYDALGRECASFDVMAVFLGISPQEMRAEYDRHDPEIGHFPMPKSWLRNAKALQAKYGTLDASELFARIVLGGDVK